MDGETHILIKGFDAIVYVSEEEGDNFEVILAEGGNEVFQITIPIPVDEDSDAAYSEDLIQYAAEAAVDLYEAARGTLGEGAGVTMKQSKRKRAYITSQWEDWYMQLKGTPFEEQATQLLEQYIELEYPDTGVEDEFNSLYEQQRAIEKDLDLLNLQRLKSANPKQTVIIINASRKKASFYRASDIQTYLEKFKNCGALEIQAIAGIQELLIIKTKIKNLEGSLDDTWEQQRDLESAMEELLLQHIQQGAIEALPDTGMDAAPAMAADIAELMQTVDLDTPVEPMIARRRAQEESKFYQNMIDALDYGSNYEASGRHHTKEDVDEWIEENGRETAKDLLDWYKNETFDQDVFGGTQHEASKLKVAKRKAFEEVEEYLTELGEQHEGLDPAEVSLDDQKFEIGDKVTFSKKFEDIGHAGVMDEISSGTSAIVESLWDGQGDCFLVALESGRVVKAPVSVLK